MRTLESTRPFPFHWQANNLRLAPKFRVSALLTIQRFIDEYLASAQFRESVQPRVLIPVDMCMLPWEYNICMAHDGAVMDMLVDVLRPG
jgi:hypothetical protein